MVLTLEQKISQMLKASGTDLTEANADGKKLDGEREDLGSEKDGVNAAAKQSKTKFPGNDKGVEATNPKQGSSDAFSVPKEDLGSAEDGKKAGENATYAGGLSDKGGAEGASKDYHTTVDPTKVISAANSKGNVDGVRLEAIDLTPIFGDADLSEDFKTKATSLFEAVVQARVNHEFETLKEQYEADLNEEVAGIKNTLVEKVDIFLDKVVAAWVQENQLAIEGGVRTEIAENFIKGLKNLFVESYVSVPEEKYDIVSDLEKQVAALKEQVETAEIQRESLAEENDKMKKSAVFAEMTEGLAATEVEKLRGLTEGIEFDTADMYKEKIRVVRENFFPKTPKVTAEKTLVNEATGDGKFTTDSVVDAYAAAIRQRMTQR